MNASLDPRDYSDPRDAAAAWFARSRSGRMDSRGRRAFAAWLQADAVHREEYALLERLWQDSGQVAHAQLRALAGAPPRAPARRGRRQALGWALAGGGALAAVGLGAGLSWQRPAEYEQTLASAHGQRLTLRLPDQSEIDLNTDSRVAVRYYADQREVELEAGEASFAVSPEASRPFIVRAGRVAVRVTGTRFNVRRLDGATEVAVSHGSVEVRAQDWRFWQRETLGPGQGLLATREGLTPAAAVDVTAVVAWRDGRVIFNDTPLPKAVAELNRYAPFSIGLEGAGLDRVSVAGVLNVDSPGTLLELLPRIAPVRVRADGAGRYVLIPAR